MNKTRRRKRPNILHILIFTVLALWSLSMFACLFWLINNSVKAPLEYELSQVTLAQNPFQYLQNYLDAFTEMTVKGNNFFNMLWNTLWVTFGNITLQVISSVVFSYIIARYKFPGRNLIYWVVITQMMLVTVGNLPATYRLYDALGLTNSPMILITNLSGTANFLIYYATFRGISKEYAESAFIDGANHFQIFGSVMVPQVKGVVLATVITSFIANWNEYMNFILYLDQYPSIASGIYYFKLASADQNYPMLLSAVVMSIIPVVVIFAVFQKEFINIDISGGLKG